MAEDKRLDLTLRPSTLDEFLGQEQLKERISIFIEAARARDEALDHVLFHGPPHIRLSTARMKNVPETSLMPRSVRFNCSTP